MTKNKTVVSLTVWLAAFLGRNMGEGGVPRLVMGTRLVGLAEDGRLLPYLS